MVEKQKRNLIGKCQSRAISMCIKFMGRKRPLVSVCYLCPKNWKHHPILLLQMCDTPETRENGGYFLQLKIQNLHHSSVDTKDCDQRIKRSKMRSHLQDVLGIIYNKYWWTKLLIKLNCRMVQRCDLQDENLSHWQSISRYSLDDT